VLIQDAYLVVRVDRRAFTSFCQQHEPLHPIDDRMVGLMNECGRRVMARYEDIVFGFGQSDEFSFIFRRSARVLNRNSIISCVVSVFTGGLIGLWGVLFPGTTLRCPPSFDSRTVTFSHFRVIRDCLSWRRAD